HAGCRRVVARSLPTRSVLIGFRESAFMREHLFGGLLKGAVSLAALAFAASLPSHAEDTIKVGVLHSLSGTMAISETTLKDVMLMLIEEQNKKGGLLGKKLEAVVVDPASNWPL